MRGRLVDLINDCRYMEGYGIDLVEKQADYLIENGVIVPPCKVGDTVWAIENVWHLDDKTTWTYHYEKEVLEFMVRSISISCNSKGIWTKKFRICQVKNGKTISHQRNIEFCDFGKTVFFTKAEAETKLKELNNSV